MSASNGDYYLPDPSPWPLVASVGLFVLAGGFVMLLKRLQHCTLGDVGWRSDHRIHDVWLVWSCSAGK